MFVAPADVHEQLPHQLTGYLVKGPSLGGDARVFGSVVAPNLKANSILEEDGKQKSPAAGRTGPDPGLCRERPAVKHLLVDMADYGSKRGQNSDLKEILTVQGHKCGFKVRIRYG